jgi:hypothetical protein
MRLFGLFMLLLLSCHLAVKADYMALHHAPRTKHYLTALAAGHRYGLCFPVKYQSGFCFRASGPMIRIVMHHTDAAGDGQTLDDTDPGIGA